MTAPSTYPARGDESGQWVADATALADGELPDGWVLVNSSAFARVAHHSLNQVFFKLFLPRSPMESVKAAIRGSRATRARRHNDDLRLAGIEAPVNIAWGRLSGGREYLFSTAVRGQGVDHWLRRELPARHHASLQQRRQLMRELGVFVGRLHHSGFVHGDLRSGNVLAEWQGERFHFALIDNERNSRHDIPPGRLLLKNLMQLNMHTPTELNRGDRWRFFLAWRRQMRELSDIEARLVALQAYQWAMRRLADKGKLPGQGSTE